MTFPDKTGYPVASQNLQDFYNLVDVYLDAVFFPLISEDTFRQEGWHYELDGTQAPLVYKGVVFNEMKGAYSSPDGAARQAQPALALPDTTYGVNSGGDPKAIPDLTYEYFKDFHADVLPPVQRAHRSSTATTIRRSACDCSTSYLSQFERIDRSRPRSRLQPRLSAPRQRRRRPMRPAPPRPARRPAMVDGQLDARRDHRPRADAGAQRARAHPGRHAGLAAAQGADRFRPGRGPDRRRACRRTSGSPISPSGSRASTRPTRDKVEALILATLEQLADEGIDPETIEAAMNTVEFALRENNTGSFPRGIALMFRSMRTWLHGGDPLAPLTFEAPLAALKARLAAGERVFEDLIRTHLLDNPHRTTVLLDGRSRTRRRARRPRSGRGSMRRSAIDDAASALAVVAADTASSRRCRTRPIRPRRWRRSRR